MSEVLPYDESISHYGDDGDEEQLSLTCRLQNNSSNFFSTAQNKRAPKLGQIGRSKRGEKTTFPLNFTKLIAHEKNSHRSCFHAI
uniref:Uncharacterized protein n=1 Tax=Cyprinus carpio TaxID=7962 RepID=A0A8C1VD09_CYPCA